MTDKPIKKRISETLTTAYVEAMDRLVEAGIHMEHQDRFRDALRSFYKQYGIKSFTTLELPKRLRRDVKYSTVFKVIDPIAHEPFTILVETFTPMGRETLFVIKALEGAYDTREEFEDARENVIRGWEKVYTRNKCDEKLYSSIVLMRPGARHLVDSLNEALNSERNIKPRLNIEEV